MVVSKSCTTWCAILLGLVSGAGALEAAQLESLSHTCLLCLAVMVQPAEVWLQPAEVLLQGLWAVGLWRAVDHRSVEPRRLGEELV